MRYSARSLVVAAVGSIVVATACFGCDDAPRRKAEEAAADEAKAKEAAAKKAEEEESKRRADAQALEEERREQAYQGAKAALEPLAKVPKKHPKGFGTACDAMLVEYDAFMLENLEGDDLTAWKSDDTKVRVLRNKCHQRSVEVVVCETEVLKKAPEGTDVDHVMRVCMEKFG